MESVDVIVIGAGAVGLAAARAFALAGQEVLVLEQHGAIGMETSSHNSEVIHAGIYYPHGSLKARFCVRGKSMLYRYLQERELPYKRCGKVIVATSEEQISTLRQYRESALANGAGELRWMSAAEIHQQEPAIRCVGALHSPTTGIVDTHAYMTSLHGDLENAGGSVVFNTRVQTLFATDSGIGIDVGDYRLSARLVINSAGLHAPGLFKTLAVDSLIDAYYARGRYYTYSGPSPFSQLIYPVAEAGGLGVHVTLDLAGQVRFGPDVEWIDGIDYRFDDGNRTGFVDAIRCYYPDLDERRIQPGYTGIRPKISAPGAPAADFVIQSEADHGIRGLINLFGIESPGITSSLAIAEHLLILNGAKTQ